MRWLCTVLFLALLGALVVVSRGMMSGELAEKPVYAALQDAELKYRARSGALVFAGRDHLVMAGFSDGASQRTWIALSAVRADGTLFAVPAGRERGIPCELARRSMGAKGIHPEVARVLMSPCRRSGVELTHSAR